MPKRDKVDEQVAGLTLLIADLESAMQRANALLAVYEGRDDDDNSEGNDEPGRST